PLDTELDDWTAAGIEKQKQFYNGIQARLRADSNLNPEEKADLDILSDQAGLGLLELQSIQSYRHNPTLYVEALGTRLFSPYVLNYAPSEQRYGHIIARLEKIPAFCGAARANLVDSPEVWNRVAREENDGNIALIDKELRANAPPDLRDSYAKAA